LIEFIEQNKSLNEPYGPIKVTGSPLEDLKSVDLEIREYARRQITNEWESIVENRGMR